MTLDRIDFLRRTLRVDRQLVGSHQGRPVFGPPMTAASVRTIPLPQVVVEALAEHIRVRGAGQEGLLFDVTRTDAGKHLAFSAGIHYCIGAALAKMEGEVALRALFDRFPDLTLTMEPHRRPSPVLRGYDAMPATLNPVSAPA